MENDSVNKQKILVAEDDPALNNALFIGLKKAGFEVETVYNGQEALDKMQEFVPDTLILDLVMPVKDGHEVLKEIHQDERLKDMVVLVFSNLDDMDNVSQAMTEGINEYLPKLNYTIEDLIAKIKEHSEAGDKLNFHYQE